MKTCLCILWSVCTIAGVASMLLSQEKQKVTGLYDHKLTSIDGQSVELAQYKGKVLLIVNVASECGMTPQYAGLQAMHARYKDQGLAILGVPCNQFGGQEPGSDKEIKAFCTSNYRVEFDMFSKTKIQGEDADPLYKWLTAAESKSVKPGPVGWNFEKFLVSRQGTVIARFDSGVEPDSPEMIEAIAKALAN
jgi:glutathione peroxidase